MSTGVDPKKSETPTTELHEEGKEFRSRLEGVNHKVIRKLMKVSVFCFTFMTIEFIGGWIAGSLAVMTDAAHLLSDLAGFIISMVSLYIALRPANYKLTYGYHRAEVIGALSSILIIWVLTAWLISEAIDRFYHPQPIMGLVMMCIAACGLLFNLIMSHILTSDPIPNAFENPNPGAENGLQAIKEEPEEGGPEAKDHPKLEKSESQIQLEAIQKAKADATRKDKTVTVETKAQDGAVDIKDDKSPLLPKAKEAENPVLRAASIHILGDIIQSVGVLLAAGIIYFFQEVHPRITFVDPICTFVFAIIVLCTSLPVSKDCLNVLMEASPKELMIDKLTTELHKVKGLVDIHDIHVWCISVGKVSISMHILSNEPQKTLEQATLICKKYGIFHSTIQVEDNSQKLHRASFIGCTHLSDNTIH